ncbi:hypothetical protein KFE25_001711 [Diacronema lutheri]|uniref:Uncharacterized protein n=1 Tax=Diacronema lutheri TaxID=2081491 RepID=A0A8J6CCX2_DIALT|nr:hypothetical protein KFE25_001711 [Diacronema lutheri]
MRLLLVALIVGGSAAFVPLGAIRCRGRGFAGTAPDCGLSQTTVVGHTPLPLHAARARLPLHAARARPRMLFNTPSRLGADIVLAIANWFGQWSIRMAPRALADAVLLTGKGLSDAVLLTGKWLTIMCVACVFVTTKLNGDERKRMRALEERRLALEERKMAFDEEERKRKLAFDEEERKRKLAFDEEERKRKLDLEERKFALDEEERKRKLAQPFTLKLWS